MAAPVDNHSIETLLGSVVGGQGEYGTIYAHLACILTVSLSVCMPKFGVHPATSKQMDSETRKWYNPEDSISGLESE